MNKKLSIIIPHYNGIDILRNCLSTLYASTFNDFEVIIVDNGSSDGSQNFIKEEFPETRLIESKKNLGYAGGCNLGYENSTGEFILFYNNDTEIDRFALEFLIKKMESDKKIAAVQPKLLSFYNKENFDYSGACGGEMDFLGYPFTRGRIFDDIEKDFGQYDEKSDEIFWASGTAMLIRKSALLDKECFDPNFFAHMEEIDLSWRLQRNNFKVVIEPKAVVFHLSGFTLSKSNPMKTYYNHRNNLLMLFKNLSAFYRFPVIFLRIVMDYIFIFKLLLGKKITPSRYILKAHFDFLKLSRKYFFRSVNFKKNGENVPTLYRKSIVFAYFIKKMKKYSDLFT
jgi:GT2 family glycosyltransferase